MKPSSDKLTSEPYSYLLVDPEFLFEDFEEYDYDFDRAADARCAGSGFIPFKESPGCDAFAIQFRDENAALNLLKIHKNCHIERKEPEPDNNPFRRKEVTYWLVTPPEKTIFRIKNNRRYLPWRLSEVPKPHYMLDMASDEFMDEFGGVDLCWSVDTNFFNQPGLTVDMVLQHIQRFSMYPVRIGHIKTARSMPSLRKHLNDKDMTIEKLNGFVCVIISNDEEASDHAYLVNDENGTLICTNGHDNLDRIFEETK